MLEVPGFLGSVMDPDGVPAGTGFQVAPGIIVTAWHVLAEAGSDRVGARVRVDALDGSGVPAETEVIGGDVRRDLAVLRSSRPLAATVPGLVPTSSVDRLTPVVVTGVSNVHDPGHSYHHLDATGIWQGGARRDGDVALGRLSSTAVMPGMSGAPVLRLSDNVAVGVVSARYNSADGWLRDSVWVARVEDLGNLLEAIPDVELGRRLMLAEPVRTVLSVRTSNAILPYRRTEVALRAQGGAHESALEATKVLIALDDTCRGLGEIDDLVESMVDAVVEGRAARGFRTRLRRRGLDPRLLFSRIAQHDEALRRWTAPLDDEDDSRAAAAGLLAAFKRALIVELETDMFDGLSDACRRYLREALLDAHSASLNAFLSAVSELLPPLRSTSVEAVPMSADPQSGTEVDRHRREVATIAAQMCRLPEPRPRFIGRSGLVDRIARALERRVAGHGSATAFLSGQPGVGTSVVAIEAARQLIPTFPGGVLHVDLNGLVADARREAQTVVRTVSEALGLGLGVETTDDAHRFAAFSAALRGRRVLLVLDNALNAAHVAPLVRAPEGCGVIVTSRDRVQSYADPGLIFRVEPLDRDDSVRMLTAFAEDGISDVRLLHRIAYLCADIPMALEMIGARMASRPDVSLDYLVRVLEEESTRLDYLDDGDRAVRVAIKLSYENLDKAAQRVFRLIAATPGAATSGAELGHCLDAPPLRQELLLNRLVDRSLADQRIVASISGDVLATFSLFDLVLLFAKEKLAEEATDVVRDFQLRAVNYLRNHLTELLQQEVGASLMGGLDPSRFHAATRLADEQGWLPLAVGLMTNLRLLYESRGERSSLIAADDTLIRLYLQSGHADAAAAVCLRKADFLWESDVSSATESARQAGSIAHEHHLPARAAEAAFKLSILLWKQGDLPGSLAAGKRAVLMLTNIGHDAAAVPVANNNCRVAVLAGDAINAVEWGRRATDLANRWGDAAARASAAFERGRAEHLAKNYRQAIEFAQEAESLYQAEEDWWNAAVSSSNAADAAQQIGDLTLAVELRAKVVDHRQRQGDLPHVVQSLIDLGAVYVLSGDYQSARRVLARGIDAIRDDRDSSIPNLLGIEVLVRHATALLFLDQPHAPYTELADLDHRDWLAEDGGRDEELEHLRDVLEHFRNGALGIDEARREAQPLLTSAARHAPEPVPAWLYEQMGTPIPDREMLEGG